MRTSAPTPRSNSGFTLVEMIGVLAVMSVLSSMLVPRVFQAISDARVTQAAASYNSIKTGVSEYFGNYGRIGGVGGADLGLATGQIFEDWDLRCLVSEGYAESPFNLRIGNGNSGSARGGSRLRVVNILGASPDTRPANNAAALDSGAYNLDGQTRTNDVRGHLLVEACIEGVDNQDAMELNNRIDGPTLGAPYGSHDEAGRVKYLVGTNGTTQVRIYVAHR